MAHLDDEELEQHVSPYCNPKISHEWEEVEFRPNTVKWYKCIKCNDYKQECQCGGANGQGVCNCPKEDE